MTSINTNTSAQAALQTLRSVNQGLNQTQNHVSSGYRVEKAKVQEEIGQLQQQLLSISQSASFNGENWVAGASGTKSVVSSFVRDGSNAVSIKTTDYVLNSGSAGNVLFGMSGGSVETS